MTVYLQQYDFIILKIYYDTSILYVTTYCSLVLLFA